MKTRFFIGLLFLIAVLFGILMLIPPEDHVQGNGGKGGNNDHGNPPITNGKSQIVNDDITQSPEWKEAEGRADFEKYERLWNVATIDIDQYADNAQGTEGGCIHSGTFEVVTAITPIGSFEERQIKLTKNNQVISENAKGFLISTISPHYIVVKTGVGSVDDPFLKRLWEKFVKGRNFFDLNVQHSIDFRIYVNDPPGSFRFVPLSPSSYKIRYARALIDDESFRGPNVSDSRDIWHEIPPNRVITYECEGYALLYELTLDSEEAKKHTTLLLRQSFDVRKLNYKTPGVGWAVATGPFFIYRDPKDLREKMSGVYTEIWMWKYAGFESAEKFLMDTYNNKFRNHLPFVYLSRYYEDWAKDYPRAIAALQHAKDAIWKMSETDPWNDCFWTKDKMQPFDWKSNEIKNMNRLIDDLNKKSQDK